MSGLPEVHRGTSPILLAQNSPRPDKNPEQLDLPYPHTTADAAKSPFAANTWVKENRVSSGARIKGVALEGLPAGSKELDGELLKVDGMTRLNGLFVYEPFADAAACKKNAKDCKTRDQFDQVILYDTIQKALKKLKSLGFDIREIVEKSHKGKFHQLLGHANYFSDMNAYFSPQEDFAAFGTSDGKWDLASDGDIDMHEIIGHMILHHMNSGLSGWYSGEGGAIHEGYSDAISAFITLDPEMSEDFPAAIGKTDDKGKGLRTVINEKIISPDVTEVHDRGEVYAGFFWALKDKIEKEGKTAAGAADIMIRVMMNHAYFYETTKPEPRDFVRAVLAGVQALDRGRDGTGTGQLGVELSKFREFVITESVKRRMIKSAADLEDKPSPPDKPEYPRSGDSEPLAALAAEPKIKFEPTETTSGIGVRREFHQEVYVTKSGEPARIIGGGKVVIYDGRGRVIKESYRDAKVPNDGFGIRGVRFNEAVTLNEADAFVELKRAVQIEFERAERALVVVRRKPIRSFKDLRALKKVEKDYRVALVARDRIKADAVGAPELVILPGENNLSYEFKLGLSLFYVSAVKKGAVTFKHDVMWD